MSAPIGVGINENVIIKNVTINDKKKLTIELAKVDPTKGKSNPFDDLLTAGVENESSGSMTLTFMSPLLPKAKEGKPDKSPEEKIELLNADIKRLKNQYTHILLQFITQDQITLNQADVMFNGTGIIDAPTFAQRILDQEVLNKIYDNLSSEFKRLITPFTNNPEFAVRFKLLRQSKEKHYATIPSRYLQDQPFIELMTVPAEQSRVKFSAYEIKEGLDNGTPIPSSSAEKKGSSDSGGEASTTPVAESNPFAAQ